jgi:hypothetical protein
MSRLALAALQHQELRRRIKEQDPNIDEETLADTVEGLTDLHDIIAAIVRASLQDEALAAGLRERIAEMEDRRGRLLERAVKRRQFARDVMVESEIRKITAPDLTLSLRPGGASLVVMDESAIPDRFWEPRAPRLDRQGLLAGLKAGHAIAGVALSNPEPVLSVRTK